MNEYNEVVSRVTEAVTRTLVGHAYTLEQYRKDMERRAQVRLLPMDVAEFRMAPSVVRNEFQRTWLDHDSLFFTMCPTFTRDRVTVLYTVRRSTFLYGKGQDNVQALVGTTSFKRAVHKYALAVRKLSLPTVRLEHSLAILAPSL